ncbi:MAG: hypothetical protein COV10_02660 [Candidatus Vogelbacteria bacterium CG10_big_fil_rev_8_21_14_0_10_51_16]|uniref:Uncharacterized protein n=1 Tax=Candidatus Vogelbacteria bacterium CG10_big_fil_rev_8_21_14_0_10_51_16 TaxID=1975045 RepID=A0A2H0RDX7_9BACT|nr:MAG: hypothetical protein COV10_02660 [Candidatus Vogelbacteria bacterium CG10_big_fil_rev_8_21_14_0_10_51_16]
MFARIGLSSLITLIAVLVLGFTPAFATEPGTSAPLPAVLETVATENGFPLSPTSSSLPEDPILEAEYYAFLLDEEEMDKYQDEQDAAWEEMRADERREAVAEAANEVQHAMRAEGFETTD